MTIQEYFQKINDKSQAVFRQSLAFPESFGIAHNLIICIKNICDYVQDHNDRCMLKKIGQQLEFSCINVAYGMYRQAYSSLRLGLELGLGAAFFSVHKLEQSEWMDGGADIVWNKLIDAENGVLSKRYAMAFFPELKGYMGEYNNRASNVYRTLSEYVHGNNSTWKNDENVLDFKKSLFDNYFVHHAEICNILIFTLLCRYLKQFSNAQIDSLQTLQSEIGYIGPLRELLGGPKE